MRHRPPSSFARLKLRHRRRMRRGPGAPPAGLPAAGRAAAPAALLNVATLGELSALLGLDGMRPLITAFFADDSRVYAELLAALEPLDGDALAHAAHRFNGAARLLGMQGLAAQAVAVEQQAHALTPASAARAAADLRQAWRASHTMCRRLAFATD